MCDLEVAKRVCGKKKLTGLRGKIVYIPLSMLVCIRGLWCLETTLSLVLALPDDNTARQLKIYLDFLISMYFLASSVTADRPIKCSARCSPLIIGLKTYEFLHTPTSVRFWISAIKLHQKEVQGLPHFCDIFRIFCYSWKIFEKNQADHDHSLKYGNVIDQNYISYYTLDWFNSAL